MYFLMVSVDLYLSYNHEKSHGPYKYTSAQLLKKSSWCQRELGSTVAGHNEIELIINNSLYKTSTPYIGLYPMRLCFFGTYIPLYDYKKISNLKAGESVQVIIANDDNVYLGRTSYLFNITTMVILLFGLILIFNFNKSFRSTPKNGAV